MTHSAEQLRERTLRSASWVTLRIVVVSLLQLGYFATTARLLANEDFGAIAIVTAVLLFTDLFSQTGIDVALLRQQGEIDRYLNPMWSVQVARGAAISLVILLLSGPVAALQGDPQVANYLMAAALIPLIDSLANNAAVILGRQLEQRRLSVAEIVSTALCVATGVVLAVLMRSPWALIINMLFFSVARATSSYFVHPYRPRFTLHWGALRRHMRYGVFYNLAAGIASVQGSLDRLLIGKFLGLELLGLYDRCYSLCTYAIQQVPKILASTAYPALASVLGAPERFKRLSHRFLVLSAIGSVAVGCVLLLLAEPLVLMILGERYRAGVPIFQVLAILVAARGLGGSLQVVLDLQARSDLRFYANLAGAVALAVCVPCGIAWGGLMGATIGVSTAAFITTAILARMLAKAARAPAPEVAGSPAVPPELTGAGRM